MGNESKSKSDLQAAPCRFCGHVGAIVQVVAPDLDDIAVTCGRCHARGPLFQGGMHEANIRRAILNWNGPVQPSIIREKVLDTFKEAREKHLAEFDKAVADLRAVISDSGWCNKLFPGFKNAFEKVTDAIGRIERLNDAEITALR